MWCCFFFSGDICGRAQQTVSNRYHLSWNPQRLVITYNPNPVCSQR